MSKKKKKLLHKWSEMFPNGRFIYYEGDNPQSFAQEMRTKFGVEVEKGNEHWAVHYDADEYGEESTSYGFFCPVEHLDEIYSDSYPMGS